MTAAQIDHTWRRLYRAESCDQRMLPMAARWLRDHLLRYPAELDGFICHTTNLIEDLCYLLGARCNEERVAVRDAVTVLLDEGYLFYEDGDLYIRNFGDYQVAAKKRASADGSAQPLSSTERSRKHREKKRAEKSAELTQQEPHGDGEGCNAQRPVQRVAQRPVQRNATGTKEGEREGEGEEKRCSLQEQRNAEDAPPVSMVTPTRGGVRTIRQVAKESLDPRRAGEWTFNLAELRTDLETMWGGWRSFLGKPGLAFPDRQEPLQPLLGLLADGRTASEVVELLRDAHPQCWHKLHAASLPQVCRNIDGLGVPASGVVPTQKPAVTIAQGGL